MRHLLSLADLTRAEMDRIFAIARDLKAKYQQGTRESLLPGRVLGLLFEKPSLRTRVSFEAGMAHLGGSTIFLGSDAGWGKRESPADFSRVLSAYVDLIAVRAFEHQKVLELASHSSVPVINALTDRSHPCQVLADLFTLREMCGRLEGLKLAYVGDCNNVTRSLALGCGKQGVHLAIAAPDGYRFDEEFEALLQRECPDLKLTVTDDPKVAVTDAAAVYTDVWTSMGQEGEAEARRAAFAPFQVNESLMECAGSALFMHCLPARRGEEVSDAVIDGPRSIIVEQAENRMHVQKGIILWLLAGTDPS